MPSELQKAAERFKRTLDATTTTTSGEQRVSMRPAAGLRLSKVAGDLDAVRAAVLDEALRPHASTTEATDGVSVGVADCGPRGADPEPVDALTRLGFALAHPNDRQHGPRFRAGDLIDAELVEALDDVLALAEGGDGGTAADLPALSDKAAAVYELLLETPAHRGLTGRQICDAMQGVEVYLDENTLTGRIIPELRPYGVENKPRIGYRIPESKRPK